MYDMVGHRVYGIFKLSRLHTVFRCTQKNFISHYLGFTQNLMYTPSPPLIQLFLPMDRY